MSTTTAPEPSVCQAAAPRLDSSARRAPRLGSYLAPDTGETRAIIRLTRPDGSTLLIDCIASTLGDGRLLAHLTSEEPFENAQILCEMYLADETRGHCRPLTQHDLDQSRPRGPSLESESTEPRDTPLLDSDGHLYRIRQIATERSVPQLRWTRSLDPGSEEPFEIVSLRHVVARLQDYEPARAITSDAVAPSRQEPSLSSSQLRSELERLACSPIVLNRVLRETVQRKVAGGELSMSEIAMRCGRIKRDRRGNLSGETSWLARRIGQMPEGGCAEPTPWVHTDVLARIARDGLAASPREVEL